MHGREPVAPPPPPSSPLPPPRGGGRVSVGLRVGWIYPRGAVMVRSSAVRRAGASAARLVTHGR